jgi:hypothetical protein
VKPPSIEQARAAAQRLCDIAGITLLRPDHPLRDVIVAGVALASKIGGSTLTRDDIAARISVALPGAGPALSLLRGVPGVGPILAAAGEAAGVGKDAVVSISPQTWASPIDLLATIQHELGHVGSIRRGRLPWCLAILVSAEARAAGEAPCYGASMAVLHSLGGWSSQAAYERAMHALGGYALDADALVLASGILKSAQATLDAGEDLGGVVMEVVTALRAEGWSP